LTVQEKDTAERLAIEAAQKDPARFAELYENNFERVYAYIARRVRDRHVAEDLTSEVFHHALAGLPRFEWRGVPFAAWLFRLAANAIIDRSKRAAKEREVPLSLDLAAEVSFEEIEDEIGQRARLFRLVERLPADQRRVIGMRFAQDKSIREIAAELGRTEGAVKQLQFRALQNLRTWERRGPGRLATKKSGDTNG
jgi:RNA polymerase sigma-70 factor (ECF subfamily)